MNDVVLGGAKVVWWRRCSGGSCRHGAVAKLAHARVVLRSARRRGILRGVVTTLGMRCRVCGRRRAVLRARRGEALRLLLHGRLLALEGVVVVVVVILMVVVWLLAQEEEGQKTNDTNSSHTTNNTTDDGANRGGLFAATTAVVAVVIATSSTSSSSASGRRAARGAGLGGAGIRDCWLKGVGSTEIKRAGGSENVWSERSPITLTCKGGVSSLGGGILKAVAPVIDNIGAKGNGVAVRSRTSRAVILNVSESSLRALRKPIN